MANLDASDGLSAKAPWLGRPGKLAVGAVALLAIIAIAVVMLKAQHDRSEQRASARLALADVSTFRASLQSQFDQRERLRRRHEALQADADAAGQARHDSRDPTFKNKEARVEYMDVEKMQALTEFSPIHDLLDAVDARYNPGQTAAARQHLREAETMRSDGMREWSRAIEFVYDTTRAALNDRYAYYSRPDIIGYYDRSARDLAHADTAASLLDADVRTIFRRVDADVAARKRELDRLR